MWIRKPDGSLQDVAPTEVHIFDSVLVVSMDHHECRIEFENPVEAAKALIEFGAAIQTKKDFIDFYRRGPNPSASSYVVTLARGDRRIATWVVDARRHDDLWHGQSLEVVGWNRSIEVAIKDDLDAEILAEILIERLNPPVPETQPDTDRGTCWDPATRRFSNPDAETDIGSPGYRNLVEKASK